MLELNKNDFKSKEEVESQIKKYKDWFSGALNGIKKPSVSAKILTIVESSLDWSFTDKTYQEIKKEKLETDSPFMLSDYPISGSEKKELLIYRQYLRDVISTVNEYSEDFQWQQEPYFIQ